jgi:hypothetical protein
LLPGTLCLADTTGEDDGVVNEGLDVHSVDSGIGRREVTYVLLSAVHQERRELSQQLGRRQNWRNVIIGREVGVPSWPNVEKSHSSHL